MNIDQAFELITLGDMKEAHRKYGPRFSLVLFNRNREVVSVLRFKKTPTEEERLQALKDNPRCVQISARPD